jgi:hypothetical protein
MAEARKPLLSHRYRLQCYRSLVSTRCGSDGSVSETGFGIDIKTRHKMNQLITHSLHMYNNHTKSNVNKILTVVANVVCLKFIFSLLHTGSNYCSRSNVLGAAA